MVRNCVPAVKPVFVRQERNVRRNRAPAGKARSVRVEQRISLELVHRHSVLTRVLQELGHRGDRKAELTSWLIS